MKQLSIFFALIIYVISLSAQTPGTIQWTFEGGANNTPAITADGTIYTPSTDGSHLYALNSEGIKQWKFTPYYNETLRAYITSTPAIGNDGTIYVRDQQLGLFFAINPDSTEKWRKDLTIGLVESDPAIAADGTIIVATTMGELIALNPDDGSEKWKINPGYSYYSSPAISGNGTIYIGVTVSGSTYLKAISSDGVEIWKFKISSDNADSSPAIGADGTIYIGSRDNNLYAVNPNGTEKWRYNAQKGIVASPVIGPDGTIYINTFDGNFHAVNPDGTEKWQFDKIMAMMSNIQLTAVIGSDSTIYIGGTSTSFQNTIYAINPDGTVKWELITDNIPYTSGTITSDGLVLIGGYQGALYAINSESTGLANSPWPKYRNNLINTAYTSVITSIEQISDKTVKDFSLSEAYPNPFNPSTNINFTIPQNGLVNISVYNAVGQNIENLLNENKTAGSYKLLWNASNVGSGLYFIKVRFQGSVYTRKCVLVK